MFCTKCGKELPDDARFCPNCGADLTAGKQMQDTANRVFENSEREFTSAIQDVRGTFNGNVSERLKDDRGLLSFIVLTIITCGIYQYYFIYQLAKDINVACEGDNDSTPGLVAFILLSLVTCGIYSLIWYYKLGNRLASNAHRYNLQFQENGTTVLLWHLFGALLCGIGPYVAMHILIKNSNAICGSYNRAHGL